jgi:uncharacterized protein YuzE
MDVVPDSKTLEESMKIKYDPKVDVIRITLKDVAIEESDEETPGIILDFDSSNNVVGIEILQASKRIDDPQAIEYRISQSVISF